MTDRWEKGIQFLADDEWRDFFSAYSNIVLIGNSEAADPAMLRDAFPATTLFVFFNKVYKVLDDQFDAPCLLISRSGVMGANIVHRREVNAVLGYFETEGFQGVINLRADAAENFSTKSSFGIQNVKHLDLEALSRDRYPQGKIPTSGYAFTAWLLTLKIPAKIVLAGFSAKRSEQWKVFDVHDWNFEQIFLRVLARRGDIVMLNRADVSRFSLLMKALPDVPQAEILAEATEVLSSRLDDANQLIDRLLSLTKIQRSLDNFLRRLKPKTRKERRLSNKK